jgi:hypothetical protein
MASAGWPLSTCAVARPSNTLVSILSAGFAALGARTVIGLIHGTFLPRVPTADQTRG